MIKQIIPWIVGILYFLSPYDIIPDMFVGPGWLDDLAVLGLAYWWYSRIKNASGPKASRPGKTYTTGAGGKQREQAFQSEEKDEDTPYSILDIQPGATKEEIKKAYLKLAAQYHPDKVQHLGEEFQKLAHEKFVAIQKAYDTLVK